jgi:hypothetical protein
MKSARKEEKSKKVDVTLFVSSDSQLVPSSEKYKVI